MAYVPHAGAVKDAQVVNGRRKGNQFENEVARPISRWLAPQHTPDDCPVYDLPFRRRSTSIMPLAGHWHGEGDLLHKPLPGIVSPFCFECKKVEGWELDGLFGSPKWPVWKWWEQCHEQAVRASLIPLMIFTRNRRSLLVMVEQWAQQKLAILPRNAPVLYASPPVTVNVHRPKVVLATLDDLVRVPLARVRKLHEKWSGPKSRP